MNLHATPFRRVISEVIEVIEQSAPESLIYCTAEAVPAIDQLREEGLTVSKASIFSELEALPLFDVALVFDLLEHKTLAEGTQFLCRLRNFNCKRIWVAVATSDDWNLSTMIGLGFRRVKCLDQQGHEICTYSYDLEYYNHKREWNTPRFWANPENWGKYRW